MRKASLGEGFFLLDYVVLTEVFGDRKTKCFERFKITIFFNDL